MNRSIVDTPEVQSLIADAARGDQDAQRVLFERYREAAYRVAYRVTGRDADALDIVQDSFIKMFQRLGDFRGTSSLKTWLLRIVTNRALDVVRGRKVRLAVSLDGDDERGIEPPDPKASPAPSRGIESRETVERIRAAIDRLPPEQRAVMALYASGEMTYGEIAEVLGIPAGTVMSRLYHARRRLQEMLPEYGSKDQPA